MTNSANLRCKQNHEEVQPLGKSRVDSWCHMSPRVWFLFFIIFLVSCVLSCDRVNRYYAICAHVYDLVLILFLINISFKWKLQLWTQRRLYLAFQLCFVHINISRYSVCMKCAAPYTHISSEHTTSNIYLFIYLFAVCWGRGYAGMGVFAFNSGSFSKGAHLLNIQPVA